MNNIFIENSNIKLNVINNKLYLIPLSENFNNKNYLELLEKLELFINDIIENNNKFYLILDVSNVNMLKIKNIFEYLYKCSIFFKKHDSFLKNHLFGTIIIMSSVINMTIFDYFLKFYKPTRPYKFYKNYNDIIYDFKL